MLRRMRAALDMGPPTVFTDFPTRRAFPKAALSIALVSLLASFAPVAASEQRAREIAASSPGVSAISPPMSIDATPYGNAHDSATPATIRVRLLDLGALPPSAFGDWDPQGSDQPQK